MIGPAALATMVVKMSATPVFDRPIKNAPTHAKSHCHQMTLYAPPMMNMILTTEDTEDTEINTLLCLRALGTPPCAAKVQLKTSDSIL
jgi:hypothetical protein